MATDGTGAYPTMPAYPAQANVRADQPTASSSGEDTATDEEVVYEQHEYHHADEYTAPLARTERK